MSPRRLLKSVLGVVLTALLLYSFYNGMVPVVPFPQNSANASCDRAESAELRFGPLPKDNAERVRRVRNTCRLTQEGYVDRMTSHAGTRSAYCVVPKTSCTFWLSLYRFLHHESGTEGHTNPLEIPRAQVHQLDDLQVMNYKSLKAHETLPEQLNNYFRFMFVRNPYSRLWSSYIDKFFLLDFWGLAGQRVVQFLESPRGVEMLSKKRKFSRCYSDITFAEFAAFVAGTGENVPQELNEHWRPVEYLCNPCLFCPHLVGRVETFAQDSLPVLKRLNLTWVLDTYDHVRHQMELLTEENFRQLGTDRFARNQEFYSSCSNTTDISRRLWTAFQMYGYIPEMDPFPKQELGANPTVHNFKKVLFRTYERVPDSVRKTLSRQRKRAMVEAFRSVPLGVMEKLSSLYLYEFLTFGYDMRPYELFSERYEQSNR